MQSMEDKDLLCPQTVPDETDDLEMLNFIGQVCIKSWINELIAV